MSKKLLDLDGLRYFYGKILSRMGNLSNPNLLINGDFQVWQRGTSFNVNSGFMYTADRWLVNTNASALVTKDTSGLKVTINSEGTFLNIAQYFEDSFLSKLIGKKITLTVEFENNIGLVEYIGYTEASNTDAFATSIKSGNKMILTFTPTVINKGYVFIQVIPDILKQGLSFVVKSAKLELGEIATPCSSRPYGEELALCQRYCVSGGFLGQCYNIYQNGLYFFVPLPQTIRINPSLITGDLRVEVNGVSQTGFTFPTIYKFANGVIIEAVKQNHGLSTNIVLVSSVAIFDAEIY